MLHWLDAQPGDSVLDVGSGSGWTSALLSQIVGPSGVVYAVEKIPELLKFGQNNCKTLGIHNVRFSLAGKEYGLPKHAPFNRILVSASAKSLPEELLEQLAINGKLVIPVKNDILEITKTSDSDYSAKSHPGYVFVPLI
jgi:protein-L-isoaspartate(D-aspartate) O-methyltransferase